MQSKNTKILFGVLTLFVFVIFSNVVFADEQTENETENTVDNIAEAKSVILKLEDDLKEKINNLDDEIKYIKETEEYDNYPAIRLNLDTPILGISSIIEQKLRITKDVTAGDISNKYSIRTIVKNGSIKIPNTYFGTLVISSKDVDLEDGINSDNFNTVILKLTQYISKVDSVNEFLDKQVNKFFKDYIAKEKLSTITEIQKRIQTSKTAINNLNDEILKIYLCNVDENEELKNRYIALNDRINELSKQLANSLITNEELINCKKDIIKIESDIIDFESDVSSKKVDIAMLSNEDFLSLLNNTKECITVKSERIKNYINDSYVYEEIKSDTADENPLEDMTNENENNDNDSKQNSQKIEVYNVVLTNYSDNIDEYLKQIDDMISKCEDEFEKEESVDSDSLENENVDENVKEEKDSVDTNLTNIDRNALVERVLKIYKDVQNKEYKFYLNNVNTKLKSSTSYLSDLIKYTDASISNYISYIYIDLPKYLNENISKNDGSFICQDELNGKLYDEMKKITDGYVDIVKIYKEMNVTDIIQDA